MKLKKILFNSLVFGVYFSIGSMYVLHGMNEHNEQKSENLNLFNKEADKLSLQLNKYVRNYNKSTSSVKTRLSAYSKSALV